MGFLRNLFRGKPKPERPTASPVDIRPQEPLPEPAAPRAVEKATLATGAVEPSGDAQSGVNIWDFDGAAEGGSETPPPASDPVADVDLPLTAPTPAPAAKPATRGRRNKTRIIGFESSNSDVVSLFDGPAAEDKGPAIVPSDAKTKSKTAPELPLGWLVIVDGPGRGHSFALTELQTSLGRGSAQSVSLDFGDDDIAEANHASVAFGADAFTVSPSKDTLASDHKVLVNDKAITASTPLVSGDMILLGSTTLRFAALCGEDFGWAETEAKEKANVATA